MAEDDIPRLAGWLAKYRARPEPIEVVVATYDLRESVPDVPEEGLSAGQVALDIVRIDKPGWPGPPDTSHYIMGVDAQGRHLWDHWYESEEAARDVLADGQYGDVVERRSPAPDDSS